MGRVLPNQAAVSTTAAKAVASLFEASALSCAVKQPLKSIVREICTLRSVGAGGGQPPPATRLKSSNGWTTRVGAAVILVAKIGGYHARSSDPPPRNQIM